MGRRLEQPSGTGSHRRPAKPHRFAALGGPVAWVADQDAVLLQEGDSRPAAEPARGAGAVAQHDIHSHVPGVSHDRRPRPSQRDRQTVRHAVVPPGSTGGDDGGRGRGRSRDRVCAGHETPGICQDVPGSPRVLVCLPGSTTNRVGRYAHSMPSSVRAVRCGSVSLSRRVLELAPAQLDKLTDLLMRQTDTGCPCGSCVRRPSRTVDSPEPGKCDNWDVQRHRADVHQARKKDPAKPRPKITLSRACRRRALVQGNVRGPRALPRLRVHASVLWRTIGLVSAAMVPHCKAGPMVLPLPGVPSASGWRTSART